MFDGGKILLNAVSQRFILSQRCFGGAMMAKIIPNKFIRIQIRRIARKKMKFQSAFKRLYISGNKPCLTNGQTVDDKKYSTAAVTYKNFQEFYSICF